MQQIKITFFGQPPNPSFLNISFPPETSNFPSNANKYWAMVIKGKARVMQGTAQKKFLHQLGELTKLSCLSQAGFLPMYGDERILVIMRLAKINKRKDTDSSVKGIQDMLQRIGITSNDKHILTWVVPSWWTAEDSDRSDLTIIPWRIHEPRILECLRNIGVPNIFHQRARASD